MRGSSSLWLRPLTSAAPILAPVDVTKRELFISGIFWLHFSPVEESDATVSERRKITTAFTVNTADSAQCLHYLHCQTPPGTTSQNEGLIYGTKEARQAETGRGWVSLVTVTKATDEQMEQGGKETACWWRKQRATQTEVKQEVQATLWLTRGEEIRSFQWTLTYERSYMISTKY